MLGRCGLSLIVTVALGVMLRDFITCPLSCIVAVAVSAITFTPLGSMLRISPMCLNAVLNSSPLIIILRHNYSYVKTIEVCLVAGDKYRLHTKGEVAQ